MLKYFICLMLLQHISEKCMLNFPLSSKAVNPEYVVVERTQKVAKFPLNHKLSPGILVS